MNGFVIFLGSFCILEYYVCRIPRISRLGQSMYVCLLLTIYYQIIKRYGQGIAVTDDVGHVGCVGSGPLNHYPKKHTPC